LIALALAVAFLCGSVPFGVVFARLRGVDLRSVGSGNIGATNAARALGRRIGVVVLVCDAAKGYAPVVAARVLFAGDARAAWLVAAVGLAAFLGHLYSPWLKLRGGKGVATGLGVFLALAPASAAVAAVVWILVYALTRVSSLGSLAGTTALLPTLLLRGEPRPTLVLGGVLYVLIVWKHRENLRRLLRREETRV
jgi:glycerol-3-phosphate acyltransferase PlsY